MLLEPEQEELLFNLVEAARSVPRAELQDFMVIPRDRDDMIIGPGEFSMPPSAQHHNDLLVLENAGLVSLKRPDNVTMFFVTPAGFEHYRQKRQEAGKPVAQVEDDIRRYLDTDKFRSRHPAAYERWTEAANLLWGADSERELTAIGHKTREAVQEFFTTLLDHHQIVEAEPKPTLTIDRLRAVIAKAKQSGQLGERQSAHLDALVVYWRATNNLIQRQEHGTQKGGDALVWEDGRRVVFQTAIVMFEIDRSL